MLHYTMGYGHTEGEKRDDWANKYNTTIKNNA
jgi:hypothetical protein